MIIICHPNEIVEKGIECLKNMRTCSRFLSTSFGRSDTVRGLKDVLLLHSAPDSMNQ